MKTISSRQNTLVRTFREVVNAPDSGDTRVLLDGVHLIREARRAALEFEAVAVASSHVIGNPGRGTWRAHWNRRERRSSPSAPRPLRR